MRSDKPLKIYDSLSGYYQRLRGEPGTRVDSQVLSSYQIIGKITSPSKVGDVDIYFDNEEALEANEKIVKALDKASEETKRETKKALIALAADVKGAEAELEAIQQELEQKDPTKEELAEAEAEAGDEVKLGRNWKTDGTVTAEVSHAIEFVRLVDFSSVDAFTETIKKTDLAEKDREITERLVSAFATEGGNTNPELVAHQMASLIARFESNGIDPSLVGPDMVKFAEQYMDHFSKARESNKRMEPLTSNRGAHSFLRKKSQSVGNKKVIALAKKKAEARIKKLKNKERKQSRS